MPPQTLALARNALTFARLPQRCIEHHLSAAPGAGARLVVEHHPAVVGVAAPQAPVVGADHRDRVSRQRRQRLADADAAGPRLPPPTRQHRRHVGCRGEEVERVDVVRSRSDLIGLRRRQPADRLAQAEGIHEFALADLGDRQSLEALGQPVAHLAVRAGGEVEAVGAGVEEPARTVGDDPAAGAHRDPPGVGGRNTSTVAEPVNSSGPAACGTSTVSPALIGMRLPTKPASTAPSITTSTA